MLKPYRNDVFMYSHHIVLFPWQLERAPNSIASWCLAAFYTKPIMQGLPMDGIFSRRSPTFYLPLLRTCLLAISELLKILHYRI